MSFNMDKYLKILFDDDTTIIDEIVNENESDVFDDEIDIITEGDNTSVDTLVNNWMENVISVEFTTKPFDEFKDIVQWILVKQNNNKDNNTTDIIAIPVDKTGKTPEDFKDILQTHHNTLMSASSSVTGVISTLKSQLNVIGYIFPTYIKIQFKDDFLKKITQTTDISDLKTKIPLDEFKTFYVFILYNVTGVSVKQIKEVIKNKIDPNGKILKNENNQRMLRQFDEFLRKYGKKNKSTIFKFNEFEVSFNPYGLTQQVQSTTQNNSTEETSGEEKDIISTSRPNKFTLHRKQNNSIVSDEEFVSSGQLYDGDMILQFIFEMNSVNMSQSSVQLRMFKQIINKLYKLQIIDTKDQEQVVQVLFAILLHIGRKDIGLENNTIELYSVLSNEKITIDNNSKDGLTNLTGLLQKLQLDLLVQDVKEYVDTGKLDNTILLNLLYEDFKKSSFYKILQQTVSKYVESTAPLYVIQNEEIMKQLQYGKKDQDTFLSKYQDEQQKYFVRLVLSKSGETKFTPDVIVVVPFKQNVIKNKSVTTIGDYNYYIITDEIKEQGTLKNQFISSYNIKYSDNDVSIKPVELQFISSNNDNTLLSNSQYVIKFEGDINGKDINDVIVDTVDNPPLVVDLDRTEIGFGGIFGFSIKTVGDAGARLGRLLRTVVDEDIPTVSNESRKYSTDILQTVIKDNKDIIYNILYESDESILKYISSRQLDILGQKYGSIYVYNTFRMLSENLFKNRQYTNVFLENIIRQIFNDDTISKIIVNSYYNGDIDEYSFTNLFIESLSELLLEKWIKHVIIEGEEETKGKKNIVYGEVSEEQERTIVGKVNTLWNKYIYNNVKKENSKYNISLLQLYDTKIIETQLQPKFVEQFKQLSENKQDKTEIIKSINSMYVDLYKELVLPVYDSTREFINEFVNFVNTYVNKINIENVDELNETIKSKIIEYVKSMISHSSEIISQPIPNTIFNNCDLTKNSELYEIIEKLTNNNTNIGSLSTFIYNKILKKIAYLLFLIKLYTQYVTNVLLLLTVEDYYVFIESIFIQGAKQFNTIKVFNNDNTKLSSDYKQLIQHLSELSKLSKSSTNQSTNDISLYFVKHMKVNIPLFTLSIQSSEKLMNSINKSKSINKLKQLNITNTEVITQLLTSLTKNMISIGIKKVGRDVETVEQNTDKVEDTIDRLLNKLSSSHDILKLSKLTSNDDIVTVLKTDKNILSKYLLYNLYTNTDIIQKLTQLIENELYNKLSKTNTNKVYIVKTYINVKYKSQDKQDGNSTPLQIIDTKIDIPQVENAKSILNNVILEYYEQLVSDNVCQLLLWQDFNHLFNIVSSIKKSKSTGTSDDRITVSVAYNQAIQLSIKAESNMYIDLKFVVYPFDKNSSIENIDTIRDVKPIIITSNEKVKLDDIEISKVTIDFVISLTLKTEIRSGTFSQDENIMAVVGKIFTNLDSGFELIMPLYSSKVKIDSSMIKNLDSNLQDILDEVVDYIKDKVK